MTDECAPKIYVNVDTSAYRESLRADLDAFYASLDLTPHLDVTSFRPFEDPPVIEP